MYTITFMFFYGWMIVWMWDYGLTKPDSYIHANSSNIFIRHHPSISMSDSHMFPLRPFGPKLGNISRFAVKPSETSTDDIGLETCITHELMSEDHNGLVANVWLPQIINVLQKYEEMYDNQILITIPKLSFYIRNLPFLEIINPTTLHKKHNTLQKNYYFPVPGTSSKPKHVNVLQVNQ